MDKKGGEEVRADGVALERRRSSSAHCIQDETNNAHPNETPAERLRNTNEEHCKEDGKARFHERRRCKGRCERQELDDRSMRAISLVLPHTPR